MLDGFTVGRYLPAASSPVGGSLLRMSRAASGISESRVISVPLIRTVADRTVRSVRTSLSDGSDRDTSAGARVQYGFPTGDRPPTPYVVVRPQRDPRRRL